MLNHSVTVKQLNLYIKSLIDSDQKLCNISVTGEISNFKNHYSSGHWYFTLKDAEAQIRCVMFKWSNERVNIHLSDGMSVTVTGRVAVYEKDGQYQLYAESISAVGEGDLALKFQQIKEKLKSEGLFDTETKRALPRFPKKIAVVTSDTGAAVKDITDILGRRYPICKIVMCPVAVQGETAAKSMIDALDKLYTLPDIDTVIIGRGGGSAEDLAAFNDEALARKIYESPFPVISAVGHETDFSISDFVADKRAATPSEAAELAVPDIAELKLLIKRYTASLSSFLNAKLTYNLDKYTTIVSKRVFKEPQYIFENKVQTLDFLSSKISVSAEKIYSELQSKFDTLVTRIDALSPLKTMSRGYAFATDNGKPIKSVKDVKSNGNLDLFLADGEIKCTVNSITERK